MSQSTDDQKPGVIQKITEAILGKSDAKIVKPNGQIVNPQGQTMKPMHLAVAAKKIEEESCDCPVPEDGSPPGTVVCHCYIQAARVMMRATGILTMRIKTEIEATETAMRKVDVLTGRNGDLATSNLRMRKRVERLEAHITEFPGKSESAIDAGRKLLDDTDA